MRLYVERNLKLVRIIDDRPPEFDINGVIIYYGHVRFINQECVECVMTYARFHNIYKEMQYE